MLNPERAKEMLRSMQTADWLMRRVKEADRLSPELRVAALALMNLDPKGKALGGYGNWEEQSKAQSAAMETLERSGAEGRAKVFSVLFPTLAPPIEAGWQLLTRLPYQAGYQRKAFRAPGDLSATRGTRTQWLTGMVQTTGPYDCDLTWFAEWAAYLGWRPDDLGILFAAAIDAGDKAGQEVFDILLASARGEHERGAMGRHVPRALLVASRPDGWEFIEKMLLAAQWQEGLRQTILETVDEAHPEAFRRMLRLMLDHDLTRFPAAVRAIDVWFGLAWDTASVRVVNQAIARTLEYLNLEGVPSHVLAGDTGSAEDTYLALWALAFRDAPAAVSPAAQLLNHADVERRFVGAHFLAPLQLPGAYRALLPALDDCDLRVVARALIVFASYGFQLDSTDLFERLERVVARYPEKKRELEPLVWPWMAMSADRQQAAGALRRHLGNRSPLKLLPYLGAMESWTRGQVVETLAKNKEHASEARDTIFSLVGDPSNYVREKALNALKGFSVTKAEAAGLEKLLTRKAGDLRRGVISLLLSQPDQQALPSAQRLLVSSDHMQRLAGLELLRKMVETSRMVEQCREMAESYSRAHPSAEGDEEKLLESVLGVARGERIEATLDNGLGLFDLAQLTPATPPLQGVQQKNGSGILNKLLGRKQGSAEPLFTSAAAGLIRSLDELVHAHREMPVALARGRARPPSCSATSTGASPHPSRACPSSRTSSGCPSASSWRSGGKADPPL